MVLLVARCYYNTYLYIRRASRQHRHTHNTVLTVVGVIDFLVVGGIQCRSGNFAVLRVVFGARDGLIERVIGRPSQP